MYLASEFTKPLYRAGEAAEILGVTTNTLRNYDRDGKINVVRSGGGHRLVPRDSLLEFLDKKGLLLDDTAKVKRDVIYARVSSHDQKNDLDRQAVYLVEHCDNLQNPLILKEVGSGLNDRRKQLQKLIGMVMAGEVQTVYVTYKDRLTRFGFNYLKTVFELNGVNIVVLNDREDKKNVEMELVDDMMSLIASFSGKLYGMRSGKNRKAGAYTVVSIQSLDELRNLIGCETVDHIFTEYFMELVARGHVLDEVADITRRHGTMQEIEAVL